ncbi:hypothetical protein ACOSQ2_003159 [Xanthoceras sorbifolium]
MNRNPLILRQTTEKERLHVLQHDSKHGLAARSQLNDQSIGCFHFFDRLDTLISRNPTLSFSLHVCGLPAPSRIDEQEQAEEKEGARERVEYQLTSLLPQLGEDPGAGNPNGNPFTAPHDSFAKRSLRRFHSCPRKQRDSEIELRRFCRDKDLQKSSSRRSQVSDSQKTSEKYLELKIVIIWYESPGCADMVVIQSSGSMVADMITALTQTIVKHRKMEPLNVDVWKMRMQLLLKERDLFFFILEKREARRSGANGFFNQEKVVLVTTMALFANISDSWWIGSSHHLFFLSEEFGANMIEELGSSYMGNGTSTVIRGRGNV